MNQQTQLQFIAKYLSRFSEQVKILNESGNFDINEHAENALINIFNKVFKCSLENINYSKRKNYPSIDLRDKDNKISFQVTATPTLRKVKDTLDKFIEHDIYKDYDELYIYILKSKQNSYSQKKIDQVTDGKFEFDTSHIIDKSDIFKKLKEENDLKIISEVREILEEQFSDQKETQKWDKYFKGLAEYDEYISNRFEYVDIKGFSPKVGNVPVSIGFSNIYVPQTISRSTDYDSYQDDQNKIKDEAAKLSPIQNLLDDKYFVILGDPGSGKSTMLKYIAYTICQNRNDIPEFSEVIPTYVQAAEYSNYFSNQQKDISEYLIDHFEKKFEKIFIDGLEEDNLLLLFDGLDEISDTHLRHQVTDRLNRFISKYPLNRLIIGYFGHHCATHFGDVVPVVSEVIVPF